MKQLKINNQFVTQKKLSQGSFGIVMLGLDQKNGNQVAIKIERSENEHIRSLEREIEILEKLVGIKGIPEIYYTGWESHYNVIVMELLQKDLASIIKQRKKLSLKSTLQLAIETILIMEKIHKQGVLHRDLKPENIMLDESNKVFLIDFGISKIYVRNNGIQIPFRDRVSFVGTSRYASIAAHKGFELSRKDDLESLFYVLLYCFKGNLPWQNLKHVPEDQRTARIGDIKETISTKELFQGLPVEFIKIYEYLRKLQYSREPDYNTIVKLLRQAAMNSSIILDHKYDWDINEDQQITRFCSLQQEDGNKKSFDKFNSHNAITPLRSQLQIPISKQDSGGNHSHGNYNSGNNLSIYNSMGIIYEGSYDGISEEIVDPIAEEHVNEIKLYCMPTQLKKPKQYYSTEEMEKSTKEYLITKYTHLKSQSVQVAINK